MYIKEYKTHPAASLFPMLSDPELDALGNDIAKHGQQMPVMVWDGQIVDGRNRWEACKRKKIQARTEDIHFESDAECVRYIISTNIHRRHLTESQRAMIASELANLKHGGDRKSDQAANLPLVKQSEAAEQMQVSERLVREAKAVQRDAPDLAAKVKAGEIKVSKAAHIARERLKLQTDPNMAADSVIDATIKRVNEGDTPRARAVLASIAKLDDTERSFIRDDVAKMLAINGPPVKAG